MSPKKMILMIEPAQGVEHAAQLLHLIITTETVKTKLINAVDRLCTTLRRHEMLRWAWL